jgi:hypothetical protein
MFKRLSRLRNRRCASVSPPLLYSAGRTVVCGETRRVSKAKLEAFGRASLRE